MRSGYPDDNLAPDSVPGLDGLGTETVQQLLDAGRVVRIPEGWVPIHAHEPSDEAYLIVEGCVEVRDGDVTVADVCRGELIGEMGLVERTLRTAQVAVVEPVVAVAWPRETFQELRRAHSDFDDLVRKIAAKRAQRNQQRRTG